MLTFNPAAVSYAAHTHDGSIRNAIIKDYEISKKNCGSVAEFIVLFLADICSIGAVTRYREKLAHNIFDDYQKNIGGIRCALMKEPDIDHPVALANGQTLSVKYGSGLFNGIHHPFVEINISGSKKPTIFSISKEQFLEKIDSDIRANPADYPKDLVADVVSFLKMKTVVSQFTTVSTLSSETRDQYQRYTLATGSFDDPFSEQPADKISATPVTEEFFNVALD